MFNEFMFFDVVKKPIIATSCLSSEMLVHNVKGVSVPQFLCVLARDCACVQLHPAFESPDPDLCSGPGLLVVSMAYMD